MKHSGGRKELKNNSHTEDELVDFLSSHEEPVEILKDSEEIVHSTLKQNETRNDRLVKQETPNNHPPKKTLVAIPCYNEEATIGSVVLKARKFADEVIVIDDGSTDNTATVAEYAGATVLRHGGNKGYGAAIQSCFNYARKTDFDVMTIIDGDGQHDAHEIQTVMTPVFQGRADVSIGSRFIDEQQSFIPKYRRLGIWVITRFTNAGSKQQQHRVTDSQSGFRTYSKAAINAIDPKDTQMGVSAEILMQGRKQNMSFVEVPISCSYAENLNTSTEGPVGHGIGVLISILKYMEVEHSLLFFGVPGLVLFILGLFFGFQVYFHYEQYHYLNIGPTLVAVALLMLGTLSAMTALILHAVVNAARRK